MFIVCCLLLVLIFSFGCESTTASKSPPLQKVQQLAAQETELQSKLTQAQAENDRLKKQIEGLSNLPGDKRADAVYHLQAVKIGRYTNLYDEDKNGTKETLVVYVQPIDEVGDGIKAAGEADVQLWDLNKKESESLIAQWHVGPNDLKKLWLNSFFGGNYRLKFDVAGKVENLDKPLTVKVAFTDYLSGRTFTEQFILRPEKTAGKP